MRRRRRERARERLEAEQRHVLGEPWVDEAPLIASDLADLARARTVAGLRLTAQLAVWGAHFALGCCVRQAEAEAMVAELGDLLAHGGSPAATYTYPTGSSPTITA